MRLILIFFCIVPYLSLQSKIESAQNKKQTKPKKNIIKKCSKFHTGKFNIKLENYGSITIIRDKETQIEFRTKDYYTKEKIIWLDECSFKKIYTEINDPIFSQKDIEALKKSEFIQKIVEIKDDRNFVLIEYRDGIQTIPIIYEKID